MNTLCTSTKTQENEQISYQTPLIQEAESLQAFFLATMENNFSYFPQNARQHYALHWEKNSLINRLTAKKDFILCAKNQKRFIGFVAGTLPEGGVATIIWLTVDPSSQNKRIGSQLLARAKQYYKELNAHKIKLTVHDKRAVKFYEREGFIIEAFHPNHWWTLDFYEMAYFIS